MTEQDILRLVENDPWRMDIFRAARSLNLPDWLIGAGFVRNPVWDYLHGYDTATPLNDIDVVYFDPEDTDEAREKEYEERLGKILPALWSVTNQARMAPINGRNYASIEEAISNWPETATAIGVRMEADDSLLLIAPYGISDLTNLIVRMTPDFSDGREYFLGRVEKKGWLNKWPKLKLVTEE